MTPSSRMSGLRPPGLAFLSVTIAAAAGILVSAGAVGAQSHLDVLHAFVPGGAKPGASLIQATDGNFYGTTELGGTSNFGTVFQIAPSGTVTVLHAFNGGDRANPHPTLLQPTDDKLYA